MPLLEDMTDPRRIYTHLTGTTADSVLREIADHLSTEAIVGEAASLHEKLMEREALCSTGVGRGVAIPHCKLNGLDAVLVAVGISREGVDFGAVDGGKVFVFFVVVSPSRAPAAHLQSLAAISRWVKEHDPVALLLDATSTHEVYRRLHLERGTDG